MIVVWLRIVLMVNIGKHIREELERQERSISWMARKLGCDRSSVYRILDRNSIDTVLLMRISVILKYDFFEVLSDELRSDM